MKKKTFFAFILSLGMLGSIFSGCSPDEKWSETFTGVLSENIYTQQSVAVASFLKNEYGVETDNAQLISTFRLTEEQAISRGMTIPKQEIFIDAEMGKVDLGQNAVSVGTLQTDRGFRYFSPLPAKGEPVSQSYFDSVIKNSAYANCTVETTYACRLSAITSNYYSKYEFADSTAHFKQNLPGLLALDCYFQDTETGIDTVMRSSETEDYGPVPYGQTLVILKGGNNYNISSFSCVADLSTFIYAVDIEANLLVKSDKGFYLPNENYQKLFSSVISEALQEFPNERDEIMETIGRFKLFGQAEYFVKEGRLDAIDIILNASFDNEILTFRLNSSFSKFGTTAVTFPQATKEK